MDLDVLNVLLVLFGPPSILGAVYGIARWSLYADREQARAMARIGELQVRAAEGERSPRKERVA
jgi:hypothetical protein